MVAGVVAYDKMASVSGLLIVADGDTGLPSFPCFTAAITDMVFLHAHLRTMLKKHNL